MNTRRLTVLVFAFCACLFPPAARAEIPDPSDDGAREDLWRYTPGACELAAYYTWQESGGPLPAMDRAKRVEGLLGQESYLEAFLWATAEKSRTEEADPLVRRALNALAAPLPGWESQLKIESPEGNWYRRAQTISSRLHLRFAPGGTPGKAGDVRFPAKDQLRLAEILLVAAVDHIDEAQAERILRFQFDIDPAYERFCRWRAFAHHTRLDNDLLEFEAANAETLPYPEALEDLAIDRLRHQEEADAFQYLMACYERFPDRWIRQAAAIRTAYKARLARLCEQHRFDEALAHLQLSLQFSFEVLDPDMATYAIFYKLLKDQESHPVDARQALIKFLLNHSVFTAASYVSEALADQQQADVVPHTYRAIMEAQLGNSGMTYRFLDAAVRNEPPSAAFFFALGLATERFKNLWTLAQRCYEQSLALDPSYEPSLLALARHEVMRGEFDSALERTGLVLVTHPENDLARYESARVHYVRGELDRAEALFRDLAASHRARPDPFYFLAEIERKRNNPAEARRWMERLLSQYPNNLRAWLILADCAKAESQPGRETAALERLYSLTRPWRFERIQAARLFRLAVDRLAALGVAHSCSPRFVLNSIKRDTIPFIPAEARQAGGAWEIPPSEDTVRVEAVSPPRWMMFDREWADTLDSFVWRDLVAFGDPWQAWHNTLEIVNPSPYEMLGVRVFADGHEFAYLYRILPKATVSVKFKSDKPPTNVGVAYTTDTGVDQVILPQGKFVRRVDPSFSGSN